MMGMVMSSKKQEGMQWWMLKWAVMRRLLATCGEREGKPSWEKKGRLLLERNREKNRAADRGETGRKRAEQRR